MTHFWLSIVFVLISNALWVFCYLWTTLTVLNSFNVFFSHNIPITHKFQVEQELLTLPEHLSSPSLFSGVHVPWSLVFCVVFWRLLFVFSPFSFGHYVPYPSLIRDSYYPFVIFRLLAIVFSILLWLEIFITPLLSSDFWPLCSLSFFD